MVDMRGTVRRDSQISPGRKALYYGGGALCVVGIAIFVSNFFGGPRLTVDAPRPGDPSFLNRMEEDHRKFREDMDSSMVRGFLGMGLVVLGAILAGIGKRGAAGSGLVLDPQQARKDLEPWNRAAGGMANDVLNEVDLAKKIGEGLGNPKVKVRCRKCEALCDEAAKFCGQCGEKL